ncbi:GntR family transcriptional regulator YhfZ [Salibacterium aidingense]|uniref:GntR family transcriptional regulator YhfZ n=1 Tax=Salibacterium aidingense TaxID=384933 RepID=UPI003BBE5629
MVRIWESLYSKNGLAAKYIAKELLKIETGERIPRVTDFCDKLALGRGTVQGAIKLLEELGGIGLDSRGHLGTFLVKKDVSVLLDISEEGPVVGVMPLPYSVKYEGLATGIVDEFERMDRRVSLAYMRGASNRLEALKIRRYDFAIVSHLAALEGKESHEGLQIIKQFGPQTYVTGHKIFFADPKKKKIENGMRVGIDRSSPDQSMCTIHECEDLDVELVDLNYMQLFNMLKQKKIDAAVWNMDEVKSVNHFNAAEFSSEKAKKLTELSSEAVVVVDENRTDIIDQIESLTNDNIKSIQQSIEGGERFPRY